MISTAAGVVPEVDRISPALQHPSGRGLRHPGDFGRLQIRPV